MTEEQEPHAEIAAPLQVAVHAQYIRDLSFESPSAPHIFSQIKEPPVLSMGVNVQTRPLDAKTHEVLLLIKMEAKAGDTTAFLAELAYGGIFGLPAMPDEHAKVFLLVEAPRLLFPFARAILAEAVRDAGFPPVLINPIDFGALYLQQQNAMDRPPQGTA